MRTTLLLILAIVHFAPGLLVAQAPTVATLTVRLDKAQQLIEHNLDSALLEMQSVAVEAKKMSDSYLLARAYEELAQMYYEKGQSDSLRWYSERALANYLTSKHPNAELEALVMKANIAQDANEDGEAMEIGFQLVERARAAGNMSMEAEGYWLISNAFFYQGQFEEANVYGEKYFELERRHSTSGAFLSRLLSQAESYQEAKDTANALRLFEEASVLLQDRFSPSLAAQYGAGYGKWLMASGALEEAEAVFREGLKHAITTGVTDLQAEITGELGRIYHAQGAFARAKRLYQQCLTLLAESEDNKTIGLFQENLARAYADLGQFDSAHHFTQLSFTSYRTYVAEDYQAQLAQQQTAYKTAEKDAQITTQRQRLWLIGAVLILAVFAGSYLLFLSRRLRRKNAENEQLVREKEGLIGEIHHRVKNNLQVIASLLSLQRRALEDAGAINAMRESQGRVEAMGLIHQKLYQGNNIAAVDMSEYLTDLTETLLDAYRLDERVELNLEVDRLQLDVDTAIPLGLIINELLTNSLKYAFPDARDGKISIDLVRENAGELRLTVADNGVGAAGAAQPKGTAFGGNLVELLARKLRGRLEISTARGYSTTLRFREVALVG